MELKISIRTPQGCAKRTQRQLRPLLLGRVIPGATYVNEDDDTLYWELEAPLRQAVKIQRNVAIFDKVISGVFQSKIMRKKVWPKLSDQDQAQLKDMLLHHTQVSILKGASAAEMTPDNLTLWEKIKKTFHKV